MLYPQEIIEEVRISNDVVEVVSEYVTLKKAGGYYKGLCPFHHEKTPSFTVTPSKQIFHCFGCGASGNVLSFIMKIENLDFIEALKLLADRANIILPEFAHIGEHKTTANHMERLLAINTEGARYFYYYLNSTKGLNGMQYLKHRNLSLETIKKFGLGFIGEEWDGLMQHLVTKGFTLEEISETGLILPRKNTKGFYDRFRNRVMFPIFDTRKRIIGFGGRVIGEGEPKYLNSPESTIFNKSKNLYGFHLAKNTKADHMLMVEGYMDVISLHQAGLDQAVASLGTALTLEQSRLLKKYTKEVIVCYDSDEAGRKATLRAMDVLSSVGLKVKVVVIPDEKDPDEFVRRHGVQGFQELLQQAAYHVDYKIELLRKKYNLQNIDQKVSFLKEFVQIIFKLDDPIEMDAYIKEIAESTNISTEAIYSEMNKQERKPSLQRIQPVTATKQPRMESTFRKGHKDSNQPTSNKALLDAQKQLLYILSEDIYVYNQVREHIELSHFTNDGLKNIAEKILRTLDQKEKIIPAELISCFDTIEEQELAASIFQQDILYDEQEKEKAINHILKMLKLNALHEMQRSYIKSLDIKSMQNIIQQINEVQQGKTYITIYERKDHF